MGGQMRPSSSSFFFQIFLVWTGLFLFHGIPIQEVTGGRLSSNFVKCGTSDDPNDPRKNFETQCDDMCRGNCMQPVQFDLTQGGGGHNLFCDCPDPCTQVTPVEGQGDLYSTKISECSTVCTDAGEDGHNILCVPPSDDGDTSKDLKNSLCVCQRKKMVKETKYCTKRYKRACDNICRETETCHHPKVKHQYCDCENTVPKKYGDQYNCTGTPPARVSRRSTKLCRQQCEMDDRDAFYCERNAKGPLTGVPRHVCACG